MNKMTRKRTQGKVKYRIEVFNGSGTSEQELDISTPSPQRAYESYSLMRERYPGRNIKITKVTEREIIGMAIIAERKITENELEKLAGR